MDKRNALAELAETLKHHIEPRRLNADKDEFAVAICKAQRIVAELAKIEQPIPLERGNGKTFTHLADILEADRKMAVEIVRNCRIIAREGADNGK